MVVWREICCLQENFSFAESFTVKALSFSCLYSESKFLTIFVVKLFLTQPRVLYTLNVCM